ncbi:hypothetical protein [Aeoliella sp.]|uniref:hypothetical protein n=1 Tax=Aeoliella sp. TaxID=2795800 RepID=UPI003CCB875C
MSTTPQHQARPSAVGRRYRLEVNAFDRVSSLLVSLLVLIGTTVAVMLIVFLFRRFSPETEQPMLQRIPKMRGEPPKGYEEDIEPPGLEDAPTDVPPQLQDTLKELTNAITSKTAMLSNEVFQSDAAQSGYGTGKGHKDYDGTGGEGGNMPLQELRFDPADDADYARMIDHFGGELAVLDRRNNKVYYAKNLAQAKPTVREGTPEAENKAQRYRLLAGGVLSEIELRLARKAGIMKAGAIILVFYPEETANKFFVAEEKMMFKNGVKELEAVDRTVFRITKEGRDYEISVEDQKYF